MKYLLASLMVLIFSTLCRGQETKTDIYADNIMIVFDASGSMGHQISANDNSIKLPLAKKALKQVLTKIPDNSNIGLFIFGDVPNDNPVKISPKNVLALGSAIDSIRASGGTPLGAYMQKAANQLLEQRQKNIGYGRYKLLVVTDGEANDSSLMERVAKEVLRRNITLEVIGVGMANKHTLSTICTAYKVANDAESLNRALAEAVAETKIVTTSTRTENDFDVIQGLSEEQAKGIIGAISNSENQPLFEAPKVVEISSTNSPSTDTSTLKAAPGASDMTIFMFIIGVIAFTVFVIVIIALVANSRY